MRDRCKISTPKEHVKYMLDLAGYTDNLWGKKILENSCGEGNFLVEIVKRYVNDCRRNGYNDETIREGIYRDITAFEVDSDYIKKCKGNIKKLSKELGIKGIKCNIISQDYLKTEPFEYNYIIGNPPYITYHDLAEDDRNYIKENYSVCGLGRFDYCYAFIERSLSELSDDGVLVYLIPFSIFRNEYAQRLRDKLIVDLVSVVDYNSISVFKDAMVTVAVIHVIKGSQRGNIRYKRESMDELIIVDKSALKGKWYFQPPKRGNRFGDFFDVQNSVATLCNEAFIITNYEDEGDYVIVGNKRIEKDILREAVSTKSCKKTKVKDIIIFPYRNCEGGYTRIAKDVFMTQYPQTVDYLSQFKDELAVRKSSDGVEWYEYGRTQALKEIYCEKLVVSVVISPNMVTYLTNESSVPYAGLFVKKKKDSKYDLSFAKELLESADFYEYTKQTGTPIAGKSFRVSVKVIADYNF